MRKAKKALTLREICVEVTLPETIMAKLEHLSLISDETVGTVIRVLLAEQTTSLTWRVEATLLTVRAENEGPRFQPPSTENCEL